MNRMQLLLINEFKLARTALPIHGVAIFQPVILFLLMSLILAHPTMDMTLIASGHPLDQPLIESLEQVGSPIGLPYVRLSVITNTEDITLSSAVHNEARGDQPTAVQVYGLIDSNKVKNLRDRLTTSALQLWNNSLGGRSVTIEEHPWLPQDVPYKLYFGMAMISFTAFLAAAIIGGILTAQDFEFHTILEYRTAPVAAGQILAARLVRLALTGLLSANLLLLIIGVITGYWPQSILLLELVILPVAVIGGSLGVIAGMLLRRSIPAYQIALVASLACWLLGGAFDLPASFGGWYETVSRLIPHAYATELLFANYFGKPIGSSSASAVALAFFTLVAIAITAGVYRLRVVRQG